MTLRIGDWEFDDVDYDVEADVLYLSIGPPRPALGEETPEGHILLFDAKTGEFCGLTLVNIGSLVARHGDARVTLPHAERIAGDALKPVLATA